MTRYSTEIRIQHKTLEEKQEYESKLGKSLLKMGYSNRTEFTKEKIRDLINTAKCL